MGVMATNRFLLLTLALASASLPLTACGDDSGSSAGDSQAEFREAALDYAECMRKNGVDMPDPQFEGNGGILMRGPRSGGEGPAFRQAEEECRKHLEKAEPPELSDEQQQEMRERALRHAQCMREHGIDFPDPTFGEDGRVEQRLEGGVNPNDPAFQEAQRECARFGPRMRMEQGS
jgi:hypothetical protein